MQRSHSLDMVKVGMECGETRDFWGLDILSRSSRCCFVTSFYLGILFVCCEPTAAPPPSHQNAMLENAVLK
jgi:hypothetical protein